MPLNPAIFNELAAANANVSVDAATTSPNALTHLVRLYGRSNGRLTIRNASQIPDKALVAIARALNDRVTLVE